MKWEPFDVSEYENDVESATSVLSSIENENYGSAYTQEIPVPLFREEEHQTYKDALSRETTVQEFSIKQEFSQKPMSAKSFYNREMDRLCQGKDTFHIIHRDIPIEIAQFKNAEQMIETRDRTKERNHPTDCKTPQSALTEERKKSTKKVFKCDHCVMSFTRPSDLQRHLLIHSNTKPYKCEECDREFTWFGNYQKHILSHVKSGGGNPAGTMPFSAMFSLLARDQLKDLFVKVFIYIGFCVSYTEISVCKFKWRRCKYED